MMLNMNNKTLRYFVNGIDQELHLMIYVLKMMKNIQCVSVWMKR